MKESPNPNSAEQPHAEPERNDRDIFLAERTQIAETSLAAASSLLSASGFSETEVARRVAAFKSDIKRFFQRQDENLNNAIAINFDKSREEFERFVSRYDSILDPHYARDPYYERSVVHDRVAEQPPVLPQNDEAADAHAAPQQHNNFNAGILHHRNKMVQQLHDNTVERLSQRAWREEAITRYWNWFQNEIDSYFSKEDARLSQNDERDVRTVILDEFAYIRALNGRNIRKIEETSAARHSVSQNESTTGKKAVATPDNVAPEDEPAEQQSNGLDEFLSALTARRVQVVELSNHNLRAALHGQALSEDVQVQWMTEFNNAIEEFFARENASLSNTNELDINTIMRNESEELTNLTNRYIDRVIMNEGFVENEGVEHPLPQNDEAAAQKNAAVADDDEFETKLASSRQKLLNGIKRSNDHELHLRGQSEDQVGLTELYIQIDAYFHERDEQLRLSPNERDIHEVRQIESADIARFNSAYMDAAFTGSIRPTLCKNKSAISKKKAAVAAPEENMNAQQEERNDFKDALSARREEIIARSIDSFRQEIYNPKYRWDDYSKNESVEELSAKINQLILDADRQLQQDGNERDIDAIIQEESQRIDELLQQAIQQNANDWNERMQHREQIIHSLRSDLLKSLKEEFLEQLPEAQQERLLERLQQINNDFIAQDAHQPTYILDRLYTDNTRATEIRKAYLKAELSEQIDQLPEEQRNLFLSQKELFWKMIEMIDTHLSNQDELDFNQMRASYARGYHQFMSYNHASNHFIEFIASRRQGIELEELDAVRDYFHSFATDNLFVNGEITETNMVSFRYGLWNVGLQLFGENIIRDYVETLVYEATQHASSEIREEIYSLTADRQEVFWNIVRFEDHQLRNQNAGENIDHFLSYYSNEDGFISAYRSLLQQVLTTTRDTSDELSNAILNYYQAHDSFLRSLSNLLGEEPQNYRNEWFNAQLINIVISGGVTTPTVEFFSDYLFYMHGGQFANMAANEQSADREQANARYQTFLSHFIGERDVHEYEIFWNSLNEFGTIGEVHQAIQQRILTNAPSNPVELECIAEEQDNAAETEEVPDVDEEQGDAVAPADNNIMSVTTAPLPGNATGMSAPDEGMNHLSGEQFVGAWSIFQDPSSS